MVQKQIAGSAEKEDNKKKENEGLTLAPTEHVDGVSIFKGNLHGEAEEEKNDVPHQLHRCYTPSDGCDQPSEATPKSHTTCKDGVRERRASSEIIPPSGQGQAPPAPMLKVFGFPLTLEEE